jgi:hypothetical protein
VVVARRLTRGRLVSFFSDRFSSRQARSETRRCKVKECAHFDRQKAVGRVDEADRLRRRLEIIQQGRERPGAERRSDVE